jgi:hypothetical protein
MVYTKIQQMFTPLKDGQNFTSSLRTVFPPQAQHAGQHIFPNDLRIPIRRVLLLNVYIAPEYAGIKRSSAIMQRRILCSRTTGVAGVKRPSSIYYPNDYHTLGGRIDTVYTNVGSKQEYTLLAEHDDNAFLPRWAPDFLEREFVRPCARATFILSFHRYSNLMD